MDLLTFDRQVKNFKIDRRKQTRLQLTIKGETNYTQTKDTIKFNEKPKYLVLIARKILFSL